jgi:hypothetical protein
MVVPPEVRIWIFALFILLDTGHAFSPIVLAWTHGGYRRQIIYTRPRKFVVVPILIFLAAVAIGVITQAGLTSYHNTVFKIPTLADWSDPFLLMVWFYSGWNLYHFGMQNYGVLRLVCSRGDWRTDMMICLVTTTFVAVILPHLIQSQWVFFIVTTGMVSVNHWVVDIGLSACVTKRAWAFIPGVVLAGIVGLIFTVPTANGSLIRLVPILICARLGLGFVHFLYSRWVWQLGDPQVRATIGRDLFHRPAGGQQKSLASA